MSGTIRATMVACLLTATGAEGQVKLQVGPPKGSEPGRVTAPVVYEDLLLVLASADGVAAVVFTDKVEKGIRYRYRYESKDRRTQQTGNGLLVWRYKEVRQIKPGEFLFEDAGSELWFKTGSGEVEWMWRTDESGWIHYDPDKVRVQIASAKEFDKLDLKRFAK